MTTDQNSSYDLVLTGGRVLDPGQGIDEQMDVAIAAGHVAKVSAGIDVSNAARVVDVAGRLVTPGLIDLHTHVAGGLRRVSADETVVPPDLVGVHAGVTTVVDAGSTGAYNVGGLVNFVIPAARTRVVAFINAGGLGIFRVPEVREASDIDIDAGIAAIGSSGHIRGVKVRMVSPAVQEMGVEVARLAKRIAAAGGVPLMVHVGDITEDHPKAGAATPALLTEVLTAGDIVTHTTSHRVGALLDNGKLRPEAKAAREKGVWFDVGVGRANFSFDSARAVMDQGLIPDTISSDVTAVGRLTLVHSLTESMNKFLALGLSLSDVIRMTTSAPAKVLGMSDNIGAIAEGREADLSVLDLADGDWLFRDATGAIARGRQALTPAFAVRAGEVVPVDFGPRPWGWLPETAG